MKWRRAFDLFMVLIAGPLFGWISLVGLAIFFLATSWRKWPDPLIDFGRELYIPWRLAHGAVLYRDVDDFYGPLSQYINGALFGLFGSSMSVLVAANLAVFAGIVITIFILFRRAWGESAAFISTAIFVSVFGFGQYVGIGNYNYATPYSHESTHGFLVCLLLVLALLRWIENPVVHWSSLAGGLIGLTMVLKPEAMLAATLITLAAVIVRWITGGRVPLSAVGAWAATAVLPTLAFACYFSAYTAWSKALQLACRAWLNAASVFAWGGPLQIAFLGLDRPWHNSVEHAGATVAAILLITVVAGVAWLADRRDDLWERILLAGLLVGVIGWLSCVEINWGTVGHCLLGLACIYALICTLSVIRDAKRGSSAQVSTLRLFLALLAVALLMRMAFNGRIYQYGFCQAAVASLLVPAVMIGELPARLGFRRWGKAMATIGTFALFTPGAVILASSSQHILGLKTLAVGVGGDQFYSFPPNVEPRGYVVRIITDWLAKQPPKETLIVLPEGEMINYLARMPSPVAPFVFYSGAASADSEAQMVKDLSRTPPDWVVIISRDLREYGIGQYGEAPGKGQQILQWVSDNYEQAMSVGDDPFDVHQRGGIILRHRGPGPPQSIP